MPLSPAALGKSDFTILSEFRYQMRRFERFSDDVIQTHGITPLQYLLLLHIKGYPGPRLGHRRRTGRAAAGQAARRGGAGHALRSGRAGASAATAAPTGAASKSTCCPRARPCWPSWRNCTAPNCSRWPACLPFRPWKDNIMSKPHYDARRDFDGQARLILISSLAAVVGALSTVTAWVLLHAIHFFTNLFFFQKFSTAFMSPAGHGLGAWVIAVPGAGRTADRPDRALRHRADTRPRHPRGDRGDPVQEKHDVAQGGGAQAARLGDRHRQRRPVRRRRADHHDRRRGRFLAGPALSPERRRAQDLAGGRRRGGHDGRVRHAGGRIAAGGGTAAVRTASAQPGAGGDRLRDRRLPAPRC